MSRSDEFSVGTNPVPSIAQGARAYSGAQGITIPPRENYGRVVMPPSVMSRIADAYDALPDFDNSAKPAFRQMAEETNRRFDHLTKPRSKGGMGINVEVSKEDPYGGRGDQDIFNEMRRDVTENNRMKVMSTATTGGHPLFDNDTNDKFRAVHDVFGHLGTGRGVDRHGEEAAFQKHSRMYSPLARRAMAVETRGQNAALHKHGEFQDQKVALLPEGMSSEKFGGAASPSELAKARVDAIFRNRRQGI